MKCSYLLLFLLFVNCNNVSSQETPIKSYVITVDDLRLRANPGLKSEVITHLKVGKVVSWGGSLSEFKEEIELRGEIFNTHYYQVETTDNVKGWVYGGAIQRISNESLTEDEAHKIESWSQFLESLNLKGLDSGGKAMNYFYDHLRNEHSLLKTAAIVVLTRFYENMEVEMWDILESIPWPENGNVEQYVNSDIPIFNRLRNSGFKISASEGMFYPKVDWKQLDDEFGKHATPSMKSFLYQRGVDSKIQVESDASIIVPISTLGDMAIRWEKYNLQFPDFVKKEISMGIENRYKLLILTGMDNSLAFTWEGIAEENFKDGWEYILKTYPESAFAKDVEDYVRLLKETGWKENSRAQKITHKYFNTYF